MTAEKPRRIVPPLYLLLCLGGVFFMDRLVPLLEWPRGWTNLSGTCFALLGAVCILWPFTAFTRARTGVVPFTEATTLITSGLYRVTRNPMYLGMALILVGAAMKSASLGAILMVPLFMLLVQWQFIQGEEQFLERTFGDEYRRYRQRVRRWL